MEGIKRHENLLSLTVVGAVDGEERLGKDQHALDHIRQLHRQGHETTRRYQ